jgi:hypothetical protein
MSRPYIKFIECDCCGQRREQTETTPNWLPDGWSELDVRRPRSLVKHYCVGCTSEIEAAAARHKEKMHEVRAAASALIDSL